MPGIDLHIAFDHAGDALTAVAAGKGLSDLKIDGDAARITADLSQPFAKIQVGAQIAGLDVRYGDYRAKDVGLTLAFDGGAGRVNVSRLSLGAPEGGKLSVDAKLDTNTMALGATLAFDGFRTGSYLPADVRAMGAGRLDGRIEAQGDSRKRRCDWARSICGWPAPPRPGCRGRFGCTVGPTRRPRWRGPTG